MTTILSQDSSALNSKSSHEPNSSDPLAPDTAEVKKDKTGVSPEKLAATPNPQTFLARIKETNQKTVEAIFKLAEVCLEARTSLPKHQRKWFFEKLPFEKSVFSKLCAIAKDSRLAKKELASKLPASISTLYELTTLEDDLLTAWSQTADSGFSCLPVDRRRYEYAFGRALCAISGL